MIRVGSWVKGVGTASDVITGVGATPKALLVWTVLRTAANGMEAADQRQCFGFSDGTNHVGVSHASLNGSLDTSFGHRNDAALISVNLSDTLELAGYPSSFDSDGFTFAWTTALAHDGAIINYIAFCGDDVSAEAGSVATSASTGQQTVTLGLSEPTVVLMLGQAPTSAATIAASGFGPMSFGWLTATEQAACSNDIAVGGIGDRRLVYQRTDRCVVAKGFGGVDFEAEAVALGANSFTLNWLVARAGRLQYLALSGLAAKSGALTAPNVDGSTSVSFPSGTPEAAILMSVGQPASTATATEDEFGFGAADAAGNQRSTWTCSRDRSGTTARYQSAAETLITGNQAAGTVTTIESRASVTIGASAVDVDWTITNADGASVVYLLLGTPAAVAYVDGDPGTIPVFELTDRLGVVRPFSDRRLNDLSGYYSGTKPARVLGFKDIRRALSDASGQVEHATAGVVLSDIPRDLRGLIDGAVTKYLTHAPVAVRTVSDADRRAELPMRTEFVGYVGPWSPRPDLQFEIDAVDWLKRKLAKRNKAPEFWQPLLSRTDFSLLPDTLIDKACPFWWGEVSDEASVAVDADLYPRGTWDPGWLELGYNHWAAAGIAAGDYCAYVTVIKDGVESTVTPFMVGFHLDGSQQPAIYFKTAATPDFYRVYFSDGRDVFHPFWAATGGTFARYRDFTPAEVPEGPTDPFGNPNTNRYVIIDSVTWGSDYRAIATTGGTTVINAGRGAIPTLYVGDETYGGKTRSAFLVQRWAMKEIVGVYVGGVKQTSVGSSTEIECPFLGDYATVFGANYRDINGRRYTIVYATGQTAIDAISGAKPITVNGTGIEANGDTTGAALTSPVRQHQWFARLLAASALPDTIFAPTSPEFGHVAGLAMIDDDSYDVAQAALEARVPTSGYTTAGGVGVGGDYESALDVLAALHLEGDFDAGFNHLGQLMVSVEPSAAPAAGAVVALDDTRDITAGSFAVSTDPSRDFFNVCPFVHTKDYVGITKGGYFFSGETRDQDSITNHDQEQNASELQCRFLRASTTAGAATVVDVMKRRQLRFRQPRRTAVLEVPYLVGADVELGSVLRLTTIEGLTASGWSGHDVRVTAIAPALSQMALRIEGYDLEPIYDGLPDDTDPTQTASGLTDTSSVIQLQENVQNLQVDLSTVQAEIVALNAAVADKVDKPTSATAKAIARFIGVDGQAIDAAAPIVQDDGRISTVTDPTSAQDVATKAYVDGLVGSLAVVTTDPASPADDTAWVFRDAGSPQGIELRLRISGTTYSISLGTL